MKDMSLHNSSCKLYNLLDSLWFDTKWSEVLISDRFNGLKKAE
jgi:hypothetical protein